MILHKLRSLMVWVLAATVGFLVARYVFPAADTHSLPEAVTDYNGLGRTALERMEYDPAAYYLERAVLIAPTEIAIWYDLGQARFNNNQPRLAMRAFEQVLYLDPTVNDSLTIEAMHALAMLYTRHNMLGLSRKLFEVLLQYETRPDRALFVRNQLAELDLTEGRYQDDGNTVYNTFNEVVGGVGEGDMRTNRHFEIARHSDDLVQKEVFFKKSLESDPGMHQAYFNVGLSLARQGRFQDALPYFEQSNQVWLAREDINPDGREKASAYAFIGHCYNRMDLPQKGRESCEKALLLDPEYFYAHLYLAEALLGLSQNDAAVSLLTELLIVNPNDREIVDLMWQTIPVVQRERLAAITGEF